MSSRYGKSLTVALAGAAWLGIATNAAAQQQSGGEEGAQTIAGAMTSGQPHVDLRYRYEFVDQDFNRATGTPFTKNANASTLRIRLNYQTEEWRDWSAFGEFDYVAEVLVKDFNSGAGTSPGREEYPVVADPRGPDLNQLYLDYGGFQDTTLRFGRRRILLDNQRFVGGVGWRQQEQTFDSVSASIGNIPNTDLFYSYVGQVNRIFGERSPAGQESTNTHLLNAKISLTGGWNLIPYGYYIDNDVTTAFSTATLGARLTGSIPAGDGKIALAGEIATQTDAGSNTVSYRAQYFHFDLDWSFSNGLAVGVGAESLGGDQNTPGKSFRTPLATLHKFQGWADQFLATPNAGVDDFYVDANYSFGAWKATVVYHDFSAQSGSANWGSEFDFSVGRKFNERYGVLFKGAVFNADDPSFSDVTKFWVMLTAAY